MSGRLKHGTLSSVRYWKRRAFHKAFDIDCPDDKAATEQAKLLVEGNAVELWQRGRIIGQIDGKRA